MFLRGLSSPWGQDGQIPGFENPPEFWKPCLLCSFSLGKYVEVMRTLLSGSDARGYDEWQQLKLAQVA